jgi:hypothetical protein
MKTKTFLTTLATVGLAFQGLASEPVIWPELSNTTSLAYAANGGFWVQRDYYDAREGLTPRGWTSAERGASNLGSINERGFIIGSPFGHGYWVVEREGKVHSRGNVPALCTDLTQCTDYDKEIIVGGAATPTGQGFWVLDRSSRVFTVGDAKDYGNAFKDSQVATGFAATPSGKGYYIVKEDGGVFAFGDAVFMGSTGGKKPSGRNVTGITVDIGPDLKVKGYWLLDVAGGIHTFGQAPFLGNGGAHPSQAINLITVPSGPLPTKGYAYIWYDGTIWYSGQ